MDNTGQRKKQIKKNSMRFFLKRYALIAMIAASLGWSMGWDIGALCAKLNLFGM